MSDIVRLNVGGQCFSTSRHTLLGGGNSFFSGLLSDRIPSSKDETGAYFIDRDPDLFRVILNYLRSGELNPGAISLMSLKNEAQYYGLDSLVKKLSLCEENFRGSCGDLLFHAYMPPPDIPDKACLDAICLDSSEAHTSSPCNSVVPSQSSSPSKDRSSKNSTERVVLRRPLFSRAKTDSPKSPATGHDKLGLEGSQSNISRPITLMTCYQNVMVVVYTDRIGVFHLKDASGWRLVWMSPTLPAPVDRVAVTSKNATGTINQNSPGISPTAPSGMSSHIGSAYGTNSVANIQSPTGQAPPQVTTVCLVACAFGPKIILWSLYPPLSSYASAVALCGSTMGVATTPTSTGLSPLFSTNSRLGRPSLLQLKEPWPHNLVGRFDLNGRAVDYLMFIGAHLVALSRRGLVGVRHVMTTMWQVWSTVPILSYSVAASELLILGCANGRICSINIEKFPLRIVNNDLLVTEMYCDPLQDPITALSMHVVKSTSDRLGCIEIAYGTLSGRVGLIVQYPENVGYSPQLLQMFSVHRSMITRVVLSEKHLISVCADSNHVRTWTISRFRGIISTHPGCIPAASFHMTTVDTTSAQSLIDSTLELAQRYFPSSGPPPRDVTRAHSDSTRTQATQSAVQHASIHRQEPQLSSQRTQRSSPHFRFPTWRRQGSQSRSSVGNPDSRVESGDSVVEGWIEPSSVGVPESQAPYQMIPGANACGAAVFVMPRTSWLHEDLGLTNGSEPEDYDDQFGATLASPTPSVQVSRCQTFHGTPSDLHDTLLASRPFSRGNVSRGSDVKSMIDIHRHANDPGPYGEREDVLVFIQKVIPTATQLFVRLASNGKRVCLIQSIDQTPISSFCIHEHDGSHRIGAHSRRYLFTGHTDGSIQVWDLTTALTAFKSNRVRDLTSSFAGADLSGCGFPTDFPGGLSNTLGATSSSFPLASTAIPLSPCSIGGPSPKELLSLLESCHLVASSNQNGVTPSDSVTSLVLSVPSSQS